MKHFLPYLFAVSLVGTAMSVTAQQSEVSSLAYGVRVYSPDGDSQALVSFPVDSPSEVTEEYDLSNYHILAAACSGDMYYMLHSDDGVSASKFLTYDMNTGALTVVKEYDWKTDLAASIILTDMTYEKYSGRLLAAGYNLNEAEVVEGEPSAPFGIFSLDPATGEATLIGQQEEHAIVALSADSEGTLLGIDETGWLWEVSSYSGFLNYDLVDLGIVPAGIQSMACDYKDGALYWASYTTDGSNNGSSQLVKIVRTPDWEYESELVGTVGNNIEVIGMFIESNPIPKGAPSVARYLNATAGAKGALNAEIVWYNPTKTIGGDALTDISVKIYRDDVLVATLENAEPGEKQTWTDTEMESGMHTYGIAVANEIAEGKRVYAPEIWVGRDVPGVPDVVAVKATEDNAITVSWSVPENGLHGGWFDPMSLTYTVVRYPDRKTVLENSPANSIIDQDITELHGYYYRVTVISADGEGGTGECKPVVSGNPHTVPYMSNFNDRDQVNQWSVFNTDGDEYTWFDHTTGWGGTWDVFFRYYPEKVLNPEEEANDWLISPPFTLEAGKLYAVKYDVRLLGALFPANTTFALGKTCSPEAMTQELEKLDGDVNDIEWITHGIPFTVKETGTYHFGYQARNKVPVQFYHFAVAEVPAIDMAAGSITGSTLTNVASVTPFEVVVTNNGFNVAESYKVELVDADDEVLASTTVNTPLGSQLRTIVTVNWTPEAQGSYTVRPRVVVDGDEVAENNTGSSLSVTVFGEGSMIHVTDGTSGTGYAPFYTQYLHSAVQTIYPADLINADDAKIKGMVYYLMMPSETTVNLEVALANVEKDDFSDNVMVGEDEFTTVFEGEIAVDRTSKNIAISFPTEFKYTGGNLCVFVRHNCSSISSLFFNAYYNSSDPLLHTAVYRSMTDAFDFSQEANGFYRDMPNVSFIADLGTSAIGNVAVGSDVTVSYDRALKAIRINGEYDVCRVYSISGAVIGEYTGLGEISTENMPSGVAIVEVVSASGRNISKIAI